MDFYFTDRKFNLLGVASTDGSTDISLANEEDKLSIEDSVRTLAGSLFYGPESRKQAEAMSALGNYVLYKDESGRSVWTTIMEINNDPLAGECVFLAEDAGVDLINELVGPYTADKAYPIASYISRFTADSGFKIGVNEISNLSRKLTGWESEESTALARILSVATQFDNAELEFRFEVNGLQVVERYIDIFKKRGKDERVTLYVDKDINRITTSGNIYDLGTSLYGIGGTPEGKDNPINLKGYKYTDPEGRYVLGSDGIMRDTVAVQKWSRLLSNDNPTPTSSHIQRRKTYETTDQKTLCDNVIRDLKKMAEVELNYEAEIVSLPYGVNIGDTIYLVDEQGELYLSARVLELVRCYSEDRYLATLGNYLIKDSGVDVNLQEIADKLKDQIKPGDTYYPWTRYADDANGTGMSSVPDGKTYMATIHRKNDPIPSDNPEDYAGQWVKIKGDEGEAGRGILSEKDTYAKSTSGTIPPTAWLADRPSVPAGQYLWTRRTTTYTDGKESYSYTPTLMGPKGEQGSAGVGLKDKAVEYAKSTSGTVPPTTGWSETIPTVGANEYLWTRTTLTYTDNSTSVAYSIGKMGANGQDAHLLYLTATAENMVFNADDTPKTAQTITISAKLQNVTGTATFKAIPYIGNTAQSAITLGGSGNNRTLSSSQWTNKDWTLVAITATLGSLNDTLSVVKVKDGSDGQDGSNGINGDGQLVFNNRFENWPASTSLAENIAMTGWDYTSYFTLLPGETDMPLHGVLQSKARASTNRGIWCKQIPVTPGTTVRISVQVKTSEVPAWGTKANVISRFYPSGTSETDNGPAFGNINGLNTTVYARPSGVLYHAAGMSTNKVNVPVVETEGVWYDVTYEVDVPEGAALLKVALNSDWINATQQWNFRRLTVVAYQKGPQGDKGDKGDPGVTGPQGPAGVDALPIFSGYVTNEAIILSATNSGAVSDFSKATGTFVTYLGQDQLTSGVTYSRVSQSGVTATINTTTGAYSVTAASADTGMVVFKAVYQGIEIQKIVSVTKAKQGNTGATGAKGSDGKDGATGAKGDPGADGVSSYLHTAWKMADGTFTVSYPQENMFNRTNGHIYAPHPLSASMTYVALPASVGKKYTASTDYKFYSSDATTDIWFDNTLETLPSSKVNGIGIKTTGAVTHTVTAISNKIYLIFRSTSILSKFVNAPWTYIAKVELGSVATALTPASEDDYTNAYPKYRGEYTDTVKADSTDPTKYTWTAYLGEQGPPTGVISQSTVPSSPYVGMLWQCTGNIAGYINPATYRWNGSKWEIYQFTAQNILAETFTGFVFRGVEFIGSKFVSEFDIPIGAEPNAHAVGQTVIENGSMVTDMVEYWTGVAGGDYDKHLEFSPDNGVFMSYKGRRSDVSQEAQLTPGGLRIKTAAAEAILSVDTIYSLVNPARNNTAPPDDANRKGVVVNYFRVGNLVNVAIKFELLKDTGWVALAPWPPSGYAPASMYQASGVAGSVSYRGQTCMVYCNTDGLRLIPTTGQGTGVFQLSLTWTTDEPFPYGDS